MSEFPNRECRTIDRARRKHGRDPRAILEPGIQRRLHLRDLVPASSGDILYGDRQAARIQQAIWHEFERAATLDEYLLSSPIHHYFGDCRIFQEVLDGPQERQNAIQAAHSSPRSRWSK